MALLIKRIKYLVILALMTAFAAHAQTNAGLRLQEQQIEAGLLYNFLKYIEWPSGSVASASPTVTVCLFGDDPFSTYLQPMSGRTVNQRSIVIRVIHRAEDADACQLVFVSAVEKDRVPSFLKSLAGKGVLTVSDVPDFTDSGGMIEFGLKDDHVSVLLNADTIAAERLHVEDRLLKLVTVVHTGAP
jgi:hypothetical protein